MKRKTLKMSSKIEVLKLPHLRTRSRLMTCLMNLATTLSEILKRSKDLITENVCSGTSAAMKLWWA